MTCAGGKPLHLAAEAGHTEVLKVLLKKGAAREAQDNKGVASVLLYSAVEAVRNFFRMLIFELLEQERFRRKTHFFFFFHQRNKHIVYTVIASINRSNSSALGRSPRSTGFPQSST